MDLDEMQPSRTSPSAPPSSRSHVQLGSQPKMAERTEQTRQRIATTRIQASLRGYWCRAALWDQVHAAIVIQAHLRGFLARIVIFEEGAAARIIQQHFLAGRHHTGTACFRALLAWQLHCSFVSRSRLIRWRASVARHSKLLQWAVTRWAHVTTPRVGLCAHRDHARPTTVTVRNGAQMQTASWSWKDGVNAKMAEQLRVALHRWCSYAIWRAHVLCISVPLTSVATRSWARRACARTLRTWSVAIVDHMLDQTREGFVSVGTQQAVSHIASVVPRDTTGGKQSTGDQAWRTVQMLPDNESIDSVRVGSGVLDEELDDEPWMLGDRGVQQAQLWRHRSHADELWRVLEHEARRSPYAGLGKLREGAKSHAGLLKLREGARSQRDQRWQRTGLHAPAVPRRRGGASRAIHALDRDRCADHARASIYTPHVSLALPSASTVTSLPSAPAHAHASPARADLASPTPSRHDTQASTALLERASAMLASPADYHGGEWSDVANALACMTTVASGGLSAAADAWVAKVEVQFNAHGIQGGSADALTDMVSSLPRPLRCREDTHPGEIVAAHATPLKPRPLPTSGATRRSSRSNCPSGGGHAQRLSLSPHWAHADRPSAAKSKATFSQTRLDELASPRAAGHGRYRRSIAVKDVQTASCTHDDATSTRMAPRRLHIDAICSHSSMAAAVAAAAAAARPSSPRPPPISTAAPPLPPKLSRSAPSAPNGQALIDSTPRRTVTGAGGSARSCFLPQT